MRIGIDARFWNETGVGRYIQNLVANIIILDKSNDYVLFVRSQDLAKVQLFTKNSNFTCIPVDIPWHSLKEQTQFTSIIKEQKVDLMHFPYFSVPISFNAPFIITIHDLILHHFPTGEASTLFLPLYYAKWLGYKLVIASAARRALHVLTVSNATKDEIIDHLGIKNEKISVIYEGVDSQLSSVSLKSQTTKPEKYFLHVGNVYPHKDPKVLVDAFSKLNDEAVSLIFVGKQDHFMKKLEEYVRKKHLKNILFKGFVPDVELANMYRNALATVVSSKMEGFGLPAVEAMINTCLVVSSDIPSLREVTKGNALFFKQGDVEGLSQLLLTLAKDEQNKYASQKIDAEKIAKEYSWERMAKETIAQYEGCNRIRQDK